MTCNQDDREAFRPWGIFRGRAPAPNELAEGHPASIPGARIATPAPWKAPGMGSAHGRGSGGPSERLGAAERLPHGPGVWINSGDLPCDLAWREGLGEWSGRWIWRPWCRGSPRIVAGDGASLKDRALAPGGRTRGSEASRFAIPAPLPIDGGRGVARARAPPRGGAPPRRSGAAGRPGWSPRSAVSGRSSPRAAPGAPGARARPSAHRPVAFPRSGLRRARSAGRRCRLGSARLDRSVVEAAAIRTGGRAWDRAARCADGRRRHRPVRPLRSQSSCRAEPRQGVSATSRPPPRRSDGLPVRGVSSPVTLREVDATGYVDAEGAGTRAFHALWVDGGERYRSSLGPVHRQSQRGWARPRLRIGWTVPRAAPITPSSSE